MLVLLASYFKESNDLSLRDSSDRCEADVNPRQIKFYCVAFIVCGWSKEACHAVLQENVSAADCKMCALAGVWSGGELVRERGLSLSKVTWCYNSHILPVGRRTMLPLPPWFSLQLTL